jgi:hypothetical protein
LRTSVAAITWTGNNLIARLVPPPIRPARYCLHQPKTWLALMPCARAISRTAGIAVLAYGTVQRYGYKDFDPRAVGQNLAVRAVAAGEMTRHNDEVFLHVELIDVGSGNQLWGELFKKPYSEIAECTENLADRISHQLRRILASDASSRRKQRTERAA